MPLLPPRELCAEPFTPQTTHANNTPADWELDGRDVAAPRIAAAPFSTAYVQSIDPATGAAYGSLTAAATGIVRDWPALGIATLGNGAEWGYSLRGSELYYMRAYGSAGNSRQLWKAYQSEGTWSQVALPYGTGRGLPWPSKDVNSPVPRLVYAFLMPSGISGVATRLVPEDAGTERVIPVPVVAKIGGPRWIPGQPRVVFTTRDETGQEQVAIFDAASGAIELVWTEPGLSVDETWASVYPDGTVAVWFVESDMILRVFTKDSGAWTEASRVTPAAAIERPARPYILSPEPFTYQGRCYIVMQLCASPGTQDQPSDIVICEPSATSGCHFRIVSPESAVSRRKPEPLILSTRAVVYYNETDAAGVRSIHMAETGL